MFLVLSFNNSEDYETTNYVECHSLYSKLEDADKAAYKLAEEDRRDLLEGGYIEEKSECEIVDKKEIYGDIEFTHTNLCNEPLKMYTCKVDDEYEPFDECSYHAVIEVKEQ